MRKHYPLDPATGVENAALLPWTDGVPSTGAEGSYPPSALCVDPETEILNAQAAAGLAASATDTTQLAQAMSIGLWLGTFGGTANALTAALQGGVAIPALVPGMRFHGLIGPNPNTGAATLNVTGFATGAGVKPARKSDGATEFGAGDLKPGGAATFVWDGAGFRLTGLAASDTSSAFIVGADTGTAGAIVVTAPLPAVVALRVNTTLVTVPAAVNAGPTTINLAGLGPKPVIYPNGSPFFGGETQPRPQVYIYDGASWEWQGQQSPVLTTALNFYVNGTTGSDTNTGLTPATAFKTIQRAASVAQALNPAGNIVNVNVADGTYAPFFVNGVINGTLNFIGNQANPSACIISATTGDCVLATYGAAITVNGFKVQNSGGNGLRSVGLGASISYLRINFGACSGYHLSGDGSTISCFGDYAISGGGTGHVSGRAATVILSPSFANTVTLTGAPAFSAAFVVGSETSDIRLSGNTTYSGSATGPRYNLTSGAVLNANGLSNAYLPGSAAGFTSDGGRYTGYSPAVEFATTGANQSDFSASGSFIVAAQIAFQATSNVARIDGAVSINHSNASGSPYYAYIDLYDATTGSLLASGPSLAGYGSTSSPALSFTPSLTSASLVPGHSYLARLQVQRAATVAAGSPSSITNPSVAGLNL